MNENCLHKNSIFKTFLGIVVYLFFIQSLFLVIKKIIFSFMDETIYSRSMVTMISMIVVFVVIVLYCRYRKCILSVFPQKFSLIYIISTVIAAMFYEVTLFAINGFSAQNALMIIYSSIVTPFFEELLFRGFVWNKLNKCFVKEWKTYLTVTLLFALWHIGYAIGIYLWNGGNLFNCIMMKVMFGVVFGLITGAIRLKTRNCYLGILMHGMLNVLG